jgi:hypothetical protein
MSANITVHQIAGSKTVVVYCGRCTGALRLALPVKAAELVQALKQFETRHSECLEAE